MARVRGGNTGYAVALVIFGAGFVIALLVAIILYTKIETHKAGEQNAKDEMAKYVSSNEMGAAGAFLGDGNKTAVAKLIEIKGLLEQDVADEQQKNAELTAANSAMNSQYNDEREIREDAQAKLASEQTEFDTIMRQRQAQINDLITQKDNLVAQISDLQTTGNRSRAEADAAAQDRIAELVQQVATLDAVQVALKQGIEDRDYEIDRLLAERPKLPADNTTLPDGQVASVFGAGRDLFITLGRSKGLVIGMTFEVFDPDPIIRLTDQGNARGKATIEVYGLEADSAACRVVRIDRGEQLEPGDPIVNLAYDPNMQIDMYAFGQFDIEGDGGANDIDRINALILENGATIPDLRMDENGIPILSPDLDYVILGAEPLLPDKPEGFDPEILAAYQAKRAEVEAYFRIVDEAKLLRIPVLNQNRFLPLIGYYVR